MANMTRVLRLAVSAVGAVLGIWYRAVLYAPDVRRRKAARRAAAK